MLQTQIPTWLVLTTTIAVFAVSFIFAIIIKKGKK